MYEVTIPFDSEGAAKRFLMELKELSFVSGIIQPSSLANAKIEEKSNDTETE